IKESDGFVVLPGGFGTLDEAFELLTLLQTGKAEPAPVVFLEVEGGSYWKAWERFVTEEVARRDLISLVDTNLYRIAGSVKDAAWELIGYYRNYHSVRWVGDTLVMRLRARPTDAELAELNSRFADMVRKPIEALSGPLAAERRSEDVVALPRLALSFDRVSYGRLRQFIDAVNLLASAPAA
ncbi:MAG: LOG family protein, partial [Acidimicrobiales bacterium]